MTNELPPQALVFSDDPNLEHQNILKAKTRAAMGNWELGARLLRMRETKDWQRVTVGGPYENWTDYLRRGASVEISTAMLYMQAAEFPLFVSLKYGIAAAGVLSRIVDLTQNEETAEEAANMMLPTDDGVPMSFDAMNYEQRQRALTLLAEQLGVARKGRRPPTPERDEARELRDRFRTAATGLIKPGQIMSRQIGGNHYIDLKAIPVDKAEEVLTALLAALKP